MPKCKCEGKSGESAIKIGLKILNKFRRSTVEVLDQGSRAQALVPRREQANKNVHCTEASL